MVVRGSFYLLITPFYLTDTMTTMLKPLLSCTGNSGCTGYLTCPQQTGCVAVSDDAYRQVQGKVSAQFIDTGAHQLKNIARPVRVYRVASQGAAVTAKASLVPPEKPSIAVLPLDNMSDAAEDVYFADGIAEDIITELSRYPDLFVAARNSSFTYRGKAVRITDVARELGVHYVLEGSVRRAGALRACRNRWKDGRCRHDRSRANAFALRIM
jgi:hypothetical protein